MDYLKNTLLAKWILADTSRLYIVIAVAIIILLLIIFVKAVRATVCGFFAMVIGGIKGANQRDRDRR